MPNYVPPEGNKSARLVLIGEAPGEREDAARRPFIGPSGAFLTSLWREVGLQRSDFYITNVHKYRPPGNDIAKIPAEVLAQSIAELHQELSTLDDPWLIIPTGNTALQALTGKKGILKHRGSIYEYGIGASNYRAECGNYAAARGNQAVKVIPTIHPAATFRDPKLAKRCRRDWQRIAGDAEFRELRLPEREHYIRPSLGDVQHFVHLVEHEADSLALDIETPRGIWTCIGFSYCPEFSITIPLTAAYWGKDLPLVWDAVGGLLSSPIPKTMQNGLFDSYYIRWHDLELNNWQWDTLAMHHALDPIDEHSLAYMASCDTREPYWKDEAKDPEEMARYTSNEDAFWVYNGKDVAVTCELQQVYYERLTREEPSEYDTKQSIRGQRWAGEDGTMQPRGSGSSEQESHGAPGATTGRLAFYQRHYRDMFEPLLGMSLSGIRVDEERRVARHADLLAQSADNLVQLSDIAGEPLHAKKGLSPVKLKRFMYETLKLPRQIKRGTGSITTDEASIRKLMRRYPEKFGEAGRLILGFRRVSKLATFMEGGLADNDGFVRCQYKFNTGTGRLASSSNPRGTGLNLQNIDHEARDIFYPHPGHVLVEVDQSQAEDRWVKVISYTMRDMPSVRRALDGRTVDWDEVLWRARAMPWENDEHWRAAEAIFGLPRSEMTKDHHRQLGKRTRHATNYDMHENKFVEALSLEDVWLTTAQARTMLQKLRQADPYIEVYQVGTRAEIMQNRQLENSWGRIYPFWDTRLDDAAYRQGYAFRPQSEVADSENQWGVVALYHWLKQEHMESILMAQVHDAVLVSAAPDEAWAIVQFLRQSMERPRVFRGVELTIPVEVSVGSSWGDKQGFKEFPTQEQLEARIEQLLEWHPVTA